MVDNSVGVAAQFAAKPHGELSDGDRHKSINYLTEKCASDTAFARTLHFGCGFGAGAGEDVLLPAGA